MITKGLSSSPSEMVRNAAFEMRATQGWMGSHLCCGLIQTKKLSRDGETERLVSWEKERASLDPI